jgi:hypothetical protein
MIIMIDSSCSSFNQHWDTITFRPAECGTLGAETSDCFRHGILTHSKDGKDTTIFISQFEELENPTVQFFYVVLLS